MTNTATPRTIMLDAMTNKVVLPPVKGRITAGAVTGAALAYMMYSFMGPKQKHPHILNENLPSGSHIKLINCTSIVSQGHGQCNLSALYTICA